MNNQALLPIFRSRSQLAILGHVLINAPAEITLPELARVTGASQPTVWREVERLTGAGVLSVKSVGRSKLVKANTASPYFPELRSLAMKLIGPAVLLGERLRSVPGVEEAFVFGSWARRYEGEVGEDAADVDLLVVGDADPDEVEGAVADLQDSVGRPVNSVVVPRDDWDAAESGFLRQVRKGPLVPVLPPA